MKKEYELVAGAKKSFWNPAQELREDKLFNEKVIVALYEDLSLKKGQKVKVTIETLEETEQEPEAPKVPEPSPPSPVPATPTPA